MGPREIIMNYFDYTTNNSSLLEILDEGSESADKRGGYTGVTLTYVWKHVLKQLVSKEDTFNILIDLIKEEYIGSIFCNNIKNYVYEKYESDYNHDRYSIEQQIEDLIEDYQENHV